MEVKEEHGSVLPGAKQILLKVKKTHKQKKYWNHFHITMPFLKNTSLKKTNPGK